VLNPGSKLRAGRFAALIAAAALIASSAEAITVSTNISLDDITLKGSTMILFGAEFNDTDDIALNIDIADGTTPVAVAPGVADYGAGLTRVSLSQGLTMIDALPPEAFGGVVGDKSLLVVDARMTGGGVSDGFGLGLFVEVEADIFWNLDVNVRLAPSAWTGVGLENLLVFEPGAFDTLESGGSCGEASFMVVNDRFSAEVAVKDVVVAPSTIPLPAGGWLLLAGIGALAAEGWRCGGFASSTDRTAR